jgi:GNAT superfamily N-acetyltransferase
MTVGYRDAGPHDAALLADLFERVFCETFAHLYDPADLAAFLAGHGEPQWREQLSDPDFAVRLAEDGATGAGYAKLGPLRLPVEPHGKAVELRQLYILAQWRGSGVAATLMDWTIAEARRRSAAELYLSVFTENARARRFYDRYGFEEVGPYKFMVGSQADEDVIMRLAL